ncbi:MAG: molybdenum cofactor guanylyltransferase [Actinomycetota bacterium]
MLAVLAATRSEGAALRVHGLIFAGGASSRFGSDKAIASIDGKALIDYVVEALNPCVDILSIVGGPVEWADDRSVEHVADDSMHGGPLVALAYALGKRQIASDDLVLIAPCDTPLIRSTTLHVLVDRAASSNGTVARSGHTSHWMLSSWRGPLLRDACVAACEAGATALHAVFEPLGPSYVEVDPIEVLSVNTPEDLSRAAQSLAQ